MKAIFGFSLVVTVVAGSASSAELKVGDKAPGFQLAGTDGRSHQLSALEGTTVVIAWFPKAFTSG